MSSLKEIRESRGIKQNAVAEHIGVSRQTYAGYESNPETLSVGQAKALCKFLHCDLEDIFLTSEVR